MMKTSSSQRYDTRGVTARWTELRDPPLVSGSWGFQSNDDAKAAWGAPSSGSVVSSSEKTDSRSASRDKSRSRSRSRGHRDSDKHVADKRSGSESGSARRSSSASSDKGRNESNTNTPRSALDGSILRRPSAELRDPPLVSGSWGFQSNDDAKAAWGAPSSGSVVSSAVSFESILSQSGVNQHRRQYPFESNTSESRTSESHEAKQYVGELTKLRNEKVESEGDLKETRCFDAKPNKQAYDYGSKRSQWREHEEHSSYGSQWREHEENPSYGSQWREHEENPSYGSIDSLQGESQR